MINTDNKTFFEAYNMFGEPECNYKGNSRGWKCSGITIGTTANQTLCINPINSKGKVVESCWIEIPKSKIPDLITFLQSKLKYPSIT